MNPKDHGKMESGGRSKNMQPPLIHQHRTFESCSSRSTSSRLDTSSYSTSATSIESSNTIFIPMDKEEELCSALERYSVHLNTEVEKSCHTSDRIRHSHGNQPEDNDDVLVITKNHNTFEKVSFRSGRLKRSSRQGIVVFNNNESQQRTTLPSRSNAQRGSKDHNKERDSNSYIGIYPHSPSHIPRSHTHVNLLAATNPQVIKSNDLNSSSDKDVVLKCVQKSTGHLENVTMATRTERERRTKEWFDKQPRPVAFPQIIDASIRPLDLAKNICSTEGVGLNRRSNSALNFFEAIPSHLLSKASGMSISNTIQEEAGVSSNPKDQSNKVKRGHQLPYRGGLDVVRHHTTHCQSGSPAETSTTSSQPSQNLLGLSQTWGNRYSGSRKRKTGGNSGNDPGDDSDDDSDDEDPRRPRPSSGKGKATDTPFLACPYFKHDPRKYIGREWRSCCGPGWDNVHRMKEHLYKHHRQPKFRCKRCGEHFKEEGYLDNHMREAEACTLQDLKPLDGFDSKQEAKLRSRKKPKPPKKLSESDKWRETYKILFPHVPEAKIPSPFYEYTECLPNSIDDYKEFVQREILGRLRDRLEHDFESIFNIVDNSSKQKALEWYLSTHLELIQSYQDVSQSGPSLPSTFTNPRSPTMVTTDLPTPPQFLGDAVQQHPNTQPAFSNSLMATDNDVLFKDSDFLELTDLNSYDPCEFTIEESHEKGATRHNDSAYESMSAKQSIRHLPG